MNISILNKVFIKGDIGGEWRERLWRWRPSKQAGLSDETKARGNKTVEIMINFMLHWTQQLVESDDSCLRYVVNICFHCWKASCSYPPFYYMVRLTYEALTVRWVWYTSGLAACQPTAPQASAYLPPNLCQQKRVAWSRGARSRICECVTSSNMLHNKSPGPSKSFTQTQS